jgi:hypothetical protein
MPIAARNADARGECNHNRKVIARETDTHTQQDYGYLPTQQHPGQRMASAETMTHQDGGQQHAATQGQAEIQPS